MSQLPTVDDVARAAGVSRQTVSNVLNAPDVVKAETRTRVEAAIAQLGYRPHEAARRLRTRQSSTIGIRFDPVGNGISGAVLDRYLHALVERAAERGMRVTLFTATDHADEIVQLQRLRDAADVDAVVVTATTYDDARIAWLIEQRIPFVSFGRPWGTDLDDPDHPWVDVDAFAGTRQATEHLFGRGLDRVGFLGWPAGSGTGDERWRGWAAAMRDRFGMPDERLHALTTSVEDGVPTARRAIERLLTGDHDLQALVCASDSLALGAMMAVREAGHPGFPVIGFDNTPVAQAVGLSSVEQQLDQVAAATLELLMGHDGRRVIPADAHPRQARNRLIEPKLVVRRSSHLAPVEEDAGSTPAGDHHREEQS